MDKYEVTPIVKKIDGTVLLDNTAQNGTYDFDSINGFICFGTETRKTDV